MKNFQKVLAICLISILFVACSSDDSATPEEENEQEEMNTENVFEGDVILINQAEVDAFVLNNYTEVNGSLQIGENIFNEPNNIDNISGFVTLTKVTGDFKFLNNRVANLNGFNNLQSINGSVEIAYNNELIEINALSNLTLVGGDFFISSQELINFDGLSGLTEIPGNFRLGYILGLPKLTNIQGLSNLVIVGNLEISGTQLVNLSGLENITQTIGSVLITENDALINVEGLNNLTDIGVDLYIRNNPMLKQINSFSNVEKIGRTLTIDSNPGLENINGLASINFVGVGVIIENNESLLEWGEAFQFAENLGSMDILDNALTTLGGFQNVTNVNFITIIGNENLTTISGFNNLMTIDSQITIKENYSLESITAFSAINSIAKNLIIFDSQIQNLDFIASLQNIGELIWINDNTALSDFCGLNTLIIDNGYSGSYDIRRNAYNPTQQDILDGNCSQ